MHEVGIVKAVISTVKGIMEEQELECVGKIVLQVGELSGIVPSYLEACYPAAVDNTFMEDTELELEVVPGISRCLDCNEEFNAYKEDFTCPVCRSKTLEALSGKEFMIKEIVAY